jgi:hypothetical protein
MIGFLHALASDPEFLVRGLLRLLDEGMKHHDPATNQEAVEGSSYA